jgi:hypothetical protein
MIRGCVETPKAQYYSISRYFLLLKMKRDVLTSSGRIDLTLQIRTIHALEQEITIIIFGFDSSSSSEHLMQPELFCAVDPNERKFSISSRVLEESFLRRATQVTSRLRFLLFYHDFDATNFLLIHGFEREEVLPVPGKGP